MGPAPHAFIAPAPSSEEHISPAPAVSHVATVLPVCTAQAPEVEYIAPAPAMSYVTSAPPRYTAPAPELEYVAPAPAVSCMAPAPAKNAEPAVIVAPAPMIEYIAPAPVVSYVVTALAMYIAPATWVWSAEQFSMRPWSSASRQCQLFLKCRQHVLCMLRQCLWWSTSCEHQCSSTCASAFCVIRGTRRDRGASTIQYETIRCVWQCRVVVEVSLPLVLTIQVGTV